MSSFGVGLRHRAVRSRDLTARDQAMRNMDVKFQRRLAEQETQIFYEHLVETKDFLHKRIKEKTGKDKLDGWIVCGSGIASLPQYKSQDIKILDTIDTSEIPNWPEPKAEGHGKELYIADIGGQIVCIQTGREHMYDTDNTPKRLRMTTSPLVVAKGLGIDWLVTTNAAGVLNNGKIQQGDVVVDVDYVNKHGVNPLIGPNDKRLGARFPSKRTIADSYIFRNLEKFIPEGHLYLGVCSLSTQAPMYESGADVLDGKYDSYLEQNPDLIQAYGMSFAMDAMIMQHFNNPPVDENGFDRPVRFIGLTAATNIISEPVAPTKEALRKAIIKEANLTSHKEVLKGAKEAEIYLIPAVIKLCKSITENPLPPIPPPEN